MQPYQALPQFLAGWDVCLMPFALNESTRFISPTKVLEYMAAQLPVVSTAIADVEKPYSHVVAVAQDHAAFIAACEQALALPEETRKAQQQTMQSIVASTSWDKTVQSMHALIESAFSRYLDASAGSVAPGDSPSDEASSEPVLRLVPPKLAHSEVEECLILGAGPTGLSAAYHYGEGATLLERNTTVAGFVAPFRTKGLPSIMRATLCFPQTKTCWRCTRRCWVTIFTGRSAKPGLYRRCLYPLSVPGIALRTACHNRQRVHSGCHRGALRDRV
ncbi:Protoporphyrinogen oxidase [Leclercia adecarboxylata]|uniref:Protoporphyrinogen oxidase n=1 Tax=Leclercia adecarboxylata TaxID=83655 RepID=A0A4U9HWE4_9ENTR|nr:Protoporphyrinogen oxidase [Leclercia adecarboxylata]